MKKSTDYDHLKKGLSPEDMGTWCRDEVRNVLKECELRINEAMELTTAYQQGKISRKEANERMHRYDRRWEFAIGGADAQYSTDEEILQTIDEQRDVPSLTTDSLTEKTNSMVDRVRRQRGRGAH